MRQAFYPLTMEVVVTAGCNGSTLSVNFMSCVHISTKLSIYSHTEGRGWGWGGGGECSWVFSDSVNYFFVITFVLERNGVIKLLPGTLQSYE